MANLIITVISIALVAVAALMGAYYGGSAFLDGQTKANANTLVAQAEQIHAAWTLSTTNNGGSWDTVAGVAGAATVAKLVTATPTYLTAAPKPPASIAGTNAWTMVKLSDNTVADGLNGLKLELSANQQANQVCVLLVQMSAGASATATNSNTSATWVAADLSPGTGRKFDCLFYTAGAETDPVAADPKIFVYRITN